MRAKRLLELYSVLALLAALAACNLTNIQTRAHSFTVGDSPRLEADVEISRLAVRSGAAGQVLVETTLRHVRQTTYQVSQSGDTIQVSLHMDEGFSTSSSQAAAEITITVPPHTDLKLRSSSGYVYVDGVSGDITLASSSGGLEVSDSQGTLTLETQTGPVVCRRTQGHFQVRTSIGSVNLSKVSGTWDVATDTGSILFEGELAAGQPHRFISSGGDIDLHLLGEPDLRVDASSQTGTVRCLVELMTPLSTRTMCRGVLGAGAGELQVQTSTAAITIR
jgi:DUF4097 and DUF4098 domain-containing protein YvlB